MPKGMPSTIKGAMRRSSRRVSTCLSERRTMLADNTILSGAYAGSSSAMGRKKAPSVTVTTVAPKPSAPSTVKASATMHTRTDNVLTCDPYAARRR